LFSYAEICKKLNAKKHSTEIASSFLDRVNSLVWDFTAIPI